MLACKSYLNTEILHLIYDFMGNHHQRGILFTPLDKYPRRFGLLKHSLNSITFQGKLILKVERGNLTITECVWISAEISFPSVWVVYTIL